uniref:ribosomal protein L2 n=1 Tax=Leptadenia pyrotechnica TaxID=1185349 RepID=UPI0022FD376E|nr:ribosomal protein L2 [Leptadenia pyrotechnica]WBG94598.1 ribosomal protein L2 [Leptadenia pyrotechnica]
MAIHLYKTSTPSTRNGTVDSQVKSNPRNNLIYGQHRCGKGRNARGIITAGHRGGGHKRLYRKIDFRRNEKDIYGRIVTIEYDPNRNASICLIHYGDGEKRYILHPRGAILGDTIVSGTEVPIKMGNALPLSTDMPLGTAIHNIEITLGRTTGIEPAHGGFTIHCLDPLGYIRPQALYIILYSLFFLYVYFYVIRLTNILYKLVLYIHILILIIYIILNNINNTK